MSGTDVDLAIVNATAQATAQCANFLKNEFANGAMFDSIVQNDVSTLPPVLQKILDKFDQKHTGLIKSALFDSVNEYARRNGGELPDAGLIASALHSGYETAKYYNENQNKINGFNDIISKEKSLFDSVALGNGDYEQSSLVPALTAVSIAMIIANGLPMVSYLPYTGSRYQPLLFMRYAFDRDHLAGRKGDYLDGDKVSLPYLEGVVEVKAVHQGGGTYKASLHSVYKDFSTLEMDENSPKMKFLGGAVSVRINAIEVGHTRDEKRGLMDTKGKFSFNAKQSNSGKVTIADEEYTFERGEVDLGDSSVELRLDKELPAGALLTVQFRVNVQDRDNNGNFTYTPASINSEATWDSIVANPDMYQVSTLEVLERQMLSEVNVGYSAQVMMQLNAKYFLEQNARLFRSAKAFAKFNQKQDYTIDLQRGASGNLTSAINTTGEIMSELLKFINKAVDDIRKSTAGATASVDLFVSDNVKQLLATLSADRYTQTGASSLHHEIVRVGTLIGGINVYQIPSSHHVLNEQDSTAEIMVIGRGSEAVKNPFVGLIVQPPVMQRVQTDARGFKLTAILDGCADLNPNERYGGGQVRVLNLINMPVLSTAR